MKFKFILKQIPQKTGGVRYTCTGHAKWDIYVPQDVLAELDPEAPAGTFPISLTFDMERAHNEQTAA